MLVREARLIVKLIHGCRCWSESSDARSAWRRSTKRSNCARLRQLQQQQQR